MAKKRMLAIDIMSSDKFIEMPLSTQALYTHYNLNADDDGFVNAPKRIQRYIGASDDDIKLLITKGYIIPFESGVLVITHWNKHNTIQKDRYTETDFIEEKNQLLLTDKGEYVLANSIDTEKCLQNGNKMETKCLQNGNTDKISIDKISKDNKYIVEYDEIISYLNEKADTHYKSNNKQTRKHINARLNEGFTVNDFKTVIDKKCNEWLGTEYEKYLRPDTLFAGKFESYLNQLGNVKSETNETNEKVEELKLKNYQLNETLNVMQHNLDIGNVDDIKEHKFQMEWLKDAIAKNNNLIEKLER